jgi:hypothetical protein
MPLLEANAAGIACCGAGRLRFVFHAVFHPGLGFAFLLVRSKRIGRRTSRLPSTSVGARDLAPRSGVESSTNERNGLLPLHANTSSGAHRMVRWIKVYNPSTSEQARRMKWHAGGV